MKATVCDTRTSWKDKLAMAANEDDYFDRFGKFEQDYSFRNEYNESYDEWADRIFTEYVKSRKSQKEIPAKVASSQEQQTPKKNKLKLKLKEEKGSSASRSCCIQDQLEKLFDADSTDVIKTKSLPFNEDSSADSIVSDLLGQTSHGSRKQIKDVIRSWHPDKFWQLFHHRIHSEHKDKIIRIVTHVSQALLNFGRLQ